MFSEIISEILHFNYFAIVCAICREQTQHINFLNLFCLYTPQKQFETKQNVTKVGFLFF